MKMKTLGRTGIAISEICLGTMTWGEQNTQAQAFEQMRAAAARDGVNIRINSGFRSNSEQADLYRRYQNGTGNLAARPGYSNHQNGRALDLNTSDSRVLNWLNQNGSHFGFARTVPSARLPSSMPFRA